MIFANRMYYGRLGVQREEKRKEPSTTSWPLFMTCTSIFGILCHRWHGVRLKTPSQTVYSGQGNDKQKYEVEAVTRPELIF